MKGKMSERSTICKQEAIDRISGLPDHLIHFIVSSLPTDEATRTTVLSKRFRSAWYSFPVLDFDCSYSSDWESITGKQEFFEYMHDCLQRRGDACLLKFRLHVNAILVGSVDRADEAIAYAIANKVKEMVVSISNPFNYSYSMPPAVLSAVFSADSVTILKLRGIDLRNLEHTKLPLMEELILRSCDMGNTLKVSSDRLKNVELLHCVGLSGIEICSSSLTSFTYKFKQYLAQPCQINLIACKSLKNLILNKVGLTDEEFKAMVSKLILLENLKLYGCANLDDISITSPSLKTLEIRGCSRLKNIVVVAVNMEVFVFEATSLSRECDVNITECKFLKVLEINNACITDRWVQKTVYRLRFLEHLKLSMCRLLERILVYHPALKHLELITCPNLTDVEFHAQTLTSFKYVGDGIRSRFCIDSPTLETDLTIQISHFQAIPYRELRDFLGFFDHCKSLSIVCRSMKHLIFPKDLIERLLPPLYDMKRLTIKSHTWSTLSDYLIELVDSLLWLSPLLETITIVSPFGDNKSLKLQYVAMTEAFGEGEEENLLGEEDQYCCRERTIKCWRHFVKKVSMENFKAGEQKKLGKYFRTEAFRLESINAP